MTRDELIHRHDQLVERHVREKDTGVATVDAILWVGTVLVELLEEVRTLHKVSALPAGDVELRCAVCGCTEDAACEGGCSWDRERTIELRVPICTNPRCIAAADQELGRGRVIVPE